MRLKLLGRISGACSEFQKTFTLIPFLLPQDGSPLAIGEMANTIAPTHPHNKILSGEKGDAGVKCILAAICLRLYPLQAAVYVWIRPNTICKYDCDFSSTSRSREARLAVSSSAVVARFSYWCCCCCNMQHPWCS